MSSQLVSFSESQKGKKLLLLNGNRYNLAVKHKSGRSNWRCVNRKKCSASVSLNECNKIIKMSAHTCLPDMKRNAIIKKIVKCKKEVCRSMEPVGRINEKVFYHTNDEQIAPSDIPPLSSLKNTLLRARYKFLNVNKGRFESLKDIKIPDEIVTSFFVYDDGIDDKILIFATPTALNVCKKINTWYGDGTFKVTPKPFFQMYTLLVDLGSDPESNYFVPVIYALLPDKSQYTYERLFNILKVQLKLQIKTYKCDYEIAVINAVKNCFGGSEIKGCYFHYMKALLKKSKEIGLSSTIEGDYITKLFIRLALLPANTIPEAYLSICDKVSDHDNELFSKFNDYFNKEWLTKINGSLFSCYGEKYRTTNSIEGWHHRINTKISKKCSLFYFLELLAKEARYQDVRIKQGEMHYEGKRRRLRDIKKDKQINHIIEDLSKNLISPEKCLELLANMI